MFIGQLQFENLFSPYGSRQLTVNKTVGVGAHLTVFEAFEPTGGYTAKSADTWPVRRLT